MLKLSDFLYPLFHWIIQTQAWTYYTQSRKSRLEGRSWRGGADEWFHFRQSHSSGSQLEPHFSSNDISFSLLIYHDASCTDLKSTIYECADIREMMERKRKLPARASARSGLSKKRTSTPPEHTPPALPTPVVEEPLPKSIAGGKPLPTIEQPQPDDLPPSQYQSVAERYLAPPNPYLSKLN